MAKKITGLEQALKDLIKRCKMAGLVDMLRLNAEYWRFSQRFCEALMKLMAQIEVLRQAHPQGRNTADFASDSDVKRTIKEIDFCCEAARITSDAYYEIHDRLAAIERDIAPNLAKAKDLAGKVPDLGRLVAALGNLGTCLKIVLHLGEEDRPLRSGDPKLN